MSNSVRPHRRQPARLPHPWGSPGKNIGVGCHFLLQCMKVKRESEVAQSCLTLSPCGLQPTRLLRPWGFSGKNTGVGCHFLLQGLSPSKGRNPCLSCLARCRRKLYLLSYQGEGTVNVCFAFFQLALTHVSKSSPSNLSFSRE